jgi:hypothetical protein
LTPSLVKSSYVTEKMLKEFHARYQDPHYWTTIMTFTANWGRKPAWAKIGARGKRAVKNERYEVQED